MSAQSGLPTLGVLTASVPKTVKKVLRGYFYTRRPSDVRQNRADSAEHEGRMVGAPGKGHATGAGYGFKMRAGQSE